MAAEWIVETRQLTRVYGDGESIRALDGIDLTVAAGELLAIMGPSGSGKSTLLNILGALDKPTSGEVWVDGCDLVHLKDQDGFRSKSVGFIFQLHNLLPTLTALENVEVPMMGHLSAADKKRRAEYLLSLVGLQDRKHHLPSQLSGGQRQRVAIARALANNPRLVLADEPTGALDTASGEELMRLIRDLNQTQGTTFLVVTHDALVARQTKRIVMMRDGKIEREDIVGSPLEEDLKLWQYSVLGRGILSGGEDVMRMFSLSEKEQKVLKSFLLKGTRGVALHSAKGS